MTFEQFLIQKYPLYKGKDLTEFKFTVAETIKLHNEYMEVIKPKNTQTNYLKTIG